MPSQSRRSVRVLVPIVALAVLLCATVRPGAAAPFKTMKDQTLRVCLYSGFAPFSYIKDNRWQGWDYDFLTAFARKHSVTLEVVPTKFDDIWLQPGQGVCDIAGSGISDTAERRGTTKTGGCWSTTYYGESRGGTYYGVLRSFLVRNADAPNLTKVEDLRGKTAIVTKGSTANLDLCYRMQLFNEQPANKNRPILPCTKACNDHPCANLTEKDRKTDPTCVLIDYPPYQNEANAACAVANGSSQDGPFLYGGGYGSIETLVKETKGLALVWTHCNMTSYKGKIAGYTEPFSFVVASGDTGLLAALNQFIRSPTTPYAGTPIPNPPQCDAPPWTTEKQPKECQE